MIQYVSGRTLRSKVEKVFGKAETNRRYGTGEFGRLYSLPAKGGGKWFYFELRKVFPSHQSAGSSSNSELLKSEPSDSEE